MTLELEKVKSIIPKSIMKRRDQIVADKFQLTLDIEHWNRENPDQVPIKIPLDFDFELDVEIEKRTGLEVAEKEAGA